MVFRKRARGARRIAALVGVALFVAGCGSSSSSSSTPAASNSPSSSTVAAASATGVAIHTTKGVDGMYLTGPSGRALYLWVADSNDKSSCSGACATAWPPLITKGAPIAAAGVNAADLGTITRADGTKQVTYKGHPLYYFVADSSAGKIKGQGSNSFGAKWWLVAPSGDAITAGGSTTAASSSGSTSSGSSSGGSSSGGSSNGGAWG
jgi:predicted lipoprotein with Yx(FWY)xxD motif